jgi:hypothetical protein
MPTEFVAENTTGRAGAATGSPERQMITLNGTRLYPGKTYRFDEFTSDVLKAMRDGLIQVQRSNGVVVSFEDLQEDYEIKSGTRTANVPTGNGGTRRVQHEYLELREKEEAQYEEVADEEAEESGSDVSAEESEQAEEEAPENDVDLSSEEAEEDTNEEDASVETEEKITFVEKLVESGEVTEDDLLSTVSMDEISSSSDLKASSAADILGDIDNIPESFVEEESRSTVTDVL